MGITVRRENRWSPHKSCQQEAEHTSAQEERNLPSGHSITVAHLGACPGPSQARCFTSVSARSGQNRMPISDTSS